MPRKHQHKYDEQHKRVPFDIAPLLAFFEQCYNADKASGLHETIKMGRVKSVNMEGHKKKRDDRHTSHPKETRRLADVPKPSLTETFHCLLDDHKKHEDRERHSHNHHPYSHRNDKDSKKEHHMLNNDNSRSLSRSRSRSRSQSPGECMSSSRSCSNSSSRSVETHHMSKGSKKVKAASKRTIKYSDDDTLESAPLTNGTSLFASLLHTDKKGKKKKNKMHE